MYAYIEQQPREPSGFPGADFCLQATYSDILRHIRAQLTHPDTFSAKVGVEGCVKKMTTTETTDFALRVADILRRWESPVI